MLWRQGSFALLHYLFFFRDGFPKCEENVIKWESRQSFGRKGWGGCRERERESTDELPPAKPLLPSLARSYCCSCSCETWKMPLSQVTTPTGKTARAATFSCWVTFVRKSTWSWSLAKYLPSIFNFVMVKSGFIFAQTRAQWRPIQTRGEGRGWSALLEGKQLAQ